jgi:hypothetical protein
MSTNVTVKALIEITATLEELIDEHNFETEDQTDHDAVHDDLKSHFDDADVIREVMENLGASVLSLDVTVGDKKVHGKPKLTTEKTD